MSDQLPVGPQPPRGVPGRDAPQHGYRGDQHAFGSAPYGAGHYGSPYGGDPREAATAAETSLILGIVGLFIFGIVLGPLAIWQASKAEKMGRSATPGKILGWIDTILGVGQILLFLAVFGTFFAIGSSR